MDDLLKELEAVALLAEKATPGPFVVDTYGDVQANGEDVARIASSGDLADHDARVVAAAVNFIRTHHAEIEAMARDASRWRYVVTHAEWIRDEDDTLMAVRLAGVQVNLESVGMRTDAIDQAMHDSAREDGNE